MVEAPAQIIGTYSPSASSWLWAWANDSLLPALCTASEAVREWGTARGHESLMQPRLDGVSAEQAADLAAIAFRLTRAKGYYRAPAGNSELHLTFGTVAIKRDDAEPELFTINID